MTFQYVRFLSRTVTVSNLETEHTKLSLELAVIIAEAFDVSLDAGGQAIANNHEVSGESICNSYCKLQQIA